jgi:hypothetical protein
MIGNIEDIRQAIALAEDMPPPDATRALTEATATLPTVIYGAGGWNRYFVYREPEGFSVFASRTHFDGNALTARRIDELGIGWF